MKPPQLRPPQPKPPQLKPPQRRLCGLVLAAGGGRRFGGPKALARDAEGVPWIQRAVDMLREGGCAEVVVVLGAQARRAASFVPDSVTVVVASDWMEGVAASLRAGLSARECLESDTVVVTPVDTPDASPRAVHRLARAVVQDPRAALAQATYRGRPGHPVLLGGDRLADIIQRVSGDRGARDYLDAHGALMIECGDLWSGADIDVPATGSTGRRVAWT